MYIFCTVIIFKKNSMADVEIISIKLKKISSHRGNMLSLSDL